MIPDSEQQLSISLPMHITNRRRGLIDGGSDILLVETIFDTLNAKGGIVCYSEAV
jgi:methionine synthase I (cobalamin-dependent)